MKATTAILSASLAALVAAAPTKTINKRATTSSCEQYATITAGSYKVLSDLWGEANGSGSQCITSDGVGSDGSISWGTTWSWANNQDDVKSFADVMYTFDAVQLSGISSMTSSYDWSYDGTSLIADVAYDMFTSSTATGSDEFEIMVWLAAIGGAGPISASYDSAGDAVSIASPTVAGYSWSLYKGSNGAQTVYSFVPASEITSFSADVYEFFTYLIESESFDSSQYLVSVQAGTEAFTGTDAVFTCSAFSIAVDTGSSSAVASSTVAASSVAAATSTSAAATSLAAVSTSAAATSTYVAPTSTSVAAVSTSAAAATSTYVAATSSVAAVSTSAAATSAASSAAAPTASASSACKVEYVYV